MTCPICGRQTVQNMRPFCSKRCADVDLARWFNESYSIPAEEEVDGGALDEATARAAEKDEPQRPN